ncbi:MAG: hypothetical protein AABY27_07085 [Pseudomonadota bacterium]
MQHNKEVVFKLATHVAENRAKKPISKKMLNNKLLAALEEDDFSEAIKYLSRLKDARSNILTYHSGDLGQGTKGLVRDARAAVDPPIIAPENYAMMHLNHARAAVLVLENARNRGEITNQQCNKLSKNIRKLAKQKIAKIESDFVNISNEDLSVLKKNDLILKLETDVKEYNNDLVNLLENNGVEKAQKQLATAKEFTSFEDEHYHVSTISKLGNATIIESEVMNLGLTEVQRKMFKAIRDYEVLDDTKQMNIPPREDMDWFNLQPRWKQDLIKGSAEAILSGTKVIPTQLRKELPLLRNSYTKVTSVQKSPNEEFKTCLEVMHSGTLTTEIPTKFAFIKKMAQAIGLWRDELIDKLTQKNINQLKQFTKDGKVNLVALTSPASFFLTVDNADSTYVRHDPDNGIYKNTMPYNIARFLPFGGGRDMSGFKEILEGNQGNQNLLTAGKHMETLGNGGDNEEHLHSQIVENMAIASYELKLLMMNLSCASGKDRTQMTLAATTIRAISQRLGISQQNVAQCLGASGSAQYLSAGNGGGTIGCNGQKKSTTSDANKEMFGKYTNYFGQRTADLNKFNTSKRKGSQDTEIMLEDSIQEVVVNATTNKQKHLVVRSQKNLPLKGILKNPPKNRSY